MKKTFARAFLCALLIFALAASATGEVLFGDGAAPLFADGEAPAPTLAPADAGEELDDIEASRLRDDGIVRVLIKSLGNPSALTLTICGSYSLEREDMRFEDGATVSVCDGGDGLYLSVGGFSMKLGDTARLVHHRDTRAETGVYIEESGYDGLFPGDFVLSRNENGGVRCVMHAPVEDYLRGVIAYEMSDSWPLDALKAQAVAARTYVMQRKAASKKRDYDVTNTTSDQVFKSVDPSYGNVTAAVRGTDGVVGTWKGKYATCWYTASNGGQTALPQDVWPENRDDAGYLARTDDPYDVENPLSVVKSYSFDFDLEGADALRAMLEGALMEKAAELGLETEGLEIEEIVDVRCADPIAEDSKMYRKIEFDLNVSAPRRVWRPAEGDIGAVVAASGEAEADLVPGLVDAMRRLLNAAPYEEVTERETLEDVVTVSLSVYDDIKRGLDDMKISSSDCELATVFGDGFSFTIELRRFGHGVGMSQRGAQRMAGVGEMGWRDILAFYYPGMKLERMNWDSPALTELAPLAFTTVSGPVPTPTPAPLPALKKGEAYAIVVLGDVSSTLNMRAEPSTLSEILITLSNAQRLIVCGEVDVQGWVAVRTAEASGFVRDEYIRRE